MFDIHRKVHDRNGELDSDRVEKYIGGLMEEFAASPEARPIIDEYGVLGWASMMMRYALDYIGVTPPEMSLPDFNEVVFELFPRKVSTEAETAPEIIAELRAFWTFLHRQYELKNAPKILATLTDDAALRLREDLANPANYGMAKSFFTLGSKAGFDMTTQEGLEAFQAIYAASLLGSQLGMPPEALLDGLVPEGTPRPLSHEDRERKRKQRKAKRQARKRNRR